MAVPHATVFFSWQSDRPTRGCRNFIEKALESAAQRISLDIGIEESPREISVDRDTKNVPGSPPIFDTILQKIDRAAVLVADLTFVSTRPNGEPASNPNVLLEYGYALKSLTYHRIIGVMNADYGEPTPDSMSFNLAHRRFPITYHTGEKASGELRRVEREQLSKNLETAIRAVLDSDEYKSSLAMPPVAPIKYREPLEGRARFRPKGEPIGFASDAFLRKLGHADIPVVLADGAAAWLRVMPRQPVGNQLKVSEVQNFVMELAAVPLYSPYSNTLLVRGVDGAGLCTPLNDEPSPTLVFLFTDAEIWIVDTHPLRTLSKLIVLEEQKFSASLVQCAKFLNDRLNVHGPYRWVAGFEGVKGRSIPLPNDSYGRTRGPCAADLIEEEGIFNLGEDPAKILEPFFARIFDRCGFARPKPSGAP